MRTLDGFVHVGVVEDNVGALAAKLERNAFEIRFGGGLHDQVADFRGAGEGHFVDAVMSSERRPRRLPESGDDIDDSVWHASLGDEFRQK